MALIKIIKRISALFNDRSQARVSVLLLSTKSTTVTEMYSPHFLHFSLFFSTKFGCLSTLYVPRLAGLQKGKLLVGIFSGSQITWKTKVKINKPLVARTDTKMQIYGEI